MNKIIILSMFLATSISQAQELVFPDDIPNIKAEARFAVMKELKLTEVGEPVKTNDGYSVAVTLPGFKCQVLVKPDEQHPKQWTAKPVYCIRLH